MIASRLYKALQQRGIQQVYSASQVAQPTSFYNTPARFFSKKEESGEEGEAAEQAEEVEAAEPEPVPQPKPKAKAKPAAAP